MREGTHTSVLARLIKKELCCYAVRYQNASSHRERIERYERSRAREERKMKQGATEPAREPKKIHIVRQRRLRQRRRVLQMVHDCMINGVWSCYELSGCWRAQIWQQKRMCGGACGTRDHVCTCVRMYGVEEEQQQRVLR